MTAPYRRITARTDDVGAVEYMVRMRDRVRLATDVYLTEDGAPGPTILTRLPYDKRGEYTFLYDIAAYFTARGYHMVVQDVRGKFRSEGETLLFVNEANDGYDTIEWITQQPWSDGIVGMWGDSYYGYTQLAAASTEHPALRAIAPRVTGTRLGALPIAQPGETVTEVEMSIHRMYPLTHFQSNDTYEWEMRWERPYADRVEEWFATADERSPSYDLWMPHPVKLRRFPDGHPFDARPIPILQTIGLYDNCAPWQWADVAMINARPGWAQNMHLQIEAIDHENHDFAELPYPDENDPAYQARYAAMMPRYLNPAIAFFDVYLRGLATPDTLPRVRWTSAGGPTRTTDSWPPADARGQTLHATPDGRLVEQAQSEEVTMSWTHDPDDAVPSPVRNAFAYLLEYPDERGLAERADVLCYESEPTTQPLTLAGPVSLHATISSTGPEMDLFGRLVDVDADQAAHLIARGQLTLRDSTKTTEVTVDLGQCGYELAVGHRLRLTLASSDFPEFVPAPGTGEHRWLAAHAALNEQTVRLGGTSGLRLKFSRLEDELIKPPTAVPSTSEDRQPAQ